MMMRRVAASTSSAGHLARLRAAASATAAMRFARERKVQVPFEEKPDENTLEGRDRSFDNYQGISNETAARAESWAELKQARDQAADEAAAAAEAYREQLRAAARAAAEKEGRDADDAETEARAKQEADEQQLEDDQVDKFYQEMIDGDRAVPKEPNFKWELDVQRDALPIGEAAPSLKPHVWAKLDPIEKLTTITDAQRSLEFFFEDDAWLPRTKEAVEDDIDDALPKYPSPSLRHVAPMPRGGTQALLSEGDFKTEPVRLGVSPACLSWLGSAMALYLRMIHDAQDITARNKNPWADTKQVSFAHKAYVLPTRMHERFIDGVVRGELTLGDRGDQFTNTAGRHIERIVVRAAEYTATDGRTASLLKTPDEDPEAVVADRLRHTIGSDHAARMCLMSALTAVASQLYIYGNVVEVHTDCPHVAAMLRHVFAAVIRSYSCLAIRTYGVAAAFDLVAEKEGSKSKHDALMVRAGTAVTTKPMPAELGPSYVSPSLLQNTWVLLANEKMSLWKVPFFTARVARYVAENQPRVVMYDEGWTGIEGFKKSVKGYLPKATADSIVDTHMQWLPVENIEYNWGERIMTHCVTVFASPEQERRSAFQRMMRQRMEIEGVREREERAKVEAATSAIGGSERSRKTRKAKAVVDESARSMPTVEVMRPMRVVGVNTTAHDALFMHPQVELSPGRVGNSLRFSSIQRSMLWRPFGTSSLFSGFGGGLQTDSETASEARAVLRQERGAKVMERSITTPILQYVAARVFGV